jgi:hypothetical protein
MLETLLDELPNTSWLCSVEVGSIEEVDDEDANDTEDDEDEDELTVVLCDVDDDETNPIASDDVDSPPKQVHD